MQDVRKQKPGPDEKTLQMLHDIVRDVAELPDRTSPDDWPEAMLVTGEELIDIMWARLSQGERTSGFDEGWNHAVDVMSGVVDPPPCKVCEAQREKRIDVLLDDNCIDTKYRDNRKAMPQASPALNNHLGWALEHLKKFITFTEDGSAYIRGTGTEIAGFAQKFHAAEESLAGAERGAELPTIELLQEILASGERFCAGVAKNDNAVCVEEVAEISGLVIKLRGVVASLRGVQERRG